MRGWAADDERPDDVVEVSIFIDNVKIAQIPCAAPRPDLKQLGIFGAGIHGFVFEFPNALPDKESRAVCVRFTSSGVALRPGEMLIGDGKTVPQGSPAAPPRDEPLMLPVPREPRGIFQLMAHLDERAGLYNLLTRLPYTTESASEVWYSAFGEMPSHRVEANFSGSYSPRDDLYHYLTSTRFQNRITQLFLRSFAEKRRIIFVHVPKCAGTDVTALLRSRYPALDKGLTDPYWTSKEQLFRRLSRLALYLPLCDAIFVSGHVRLADYADLQLIRPQDRIFTIVRDPIEIAVSQANYVVTRIASDSEAGSAGPDTREWLRMFGTELPPRGLSEELARTLVKKVLYHPEIVTKDLICHWLGQSDAKSALDLLIANNVEVSDTGHYNDWLVQEWGIRSATRMNRSRPFLSLDQLTQSDQDYLRNLLKEDLRLYAALQSAFGASTKMSLARSDLERVTL
jgi:hypothetical protein